jgi:hypothetical protein
MTYMHTVCLKHNRLRIYIYIYIYIVPGWRYLLGIMDSATQFQLSLFIPDYTVGITIAPLQTVFTHKLC